MDEELDRIFDRLEALLTQYSPPFTIRTAEVQDKRNYHLWSEKPVVIDGRKKNEVFFAGLIAQKGYVGLYYMPVYAEPDVKQIFAPELLRLLKGKSCFHVRRLDDDLEGQISAALDAGLELYRKRGWV